MKTVTICGSMRYTEEMKRIAYELTIHSNFNVLQCVYLPLNVNVTNLERKALSDAHLQRICLSDAIFVLDIDGYIGETTRKEIDFAIQKGKEIIFYSQFVK